jgi:hypothetical protein
VEGERKERPESGSYLKAIKIDNPTQPNPTQPNPTTGPTKRVLLVVWMVENVGRDRHGSEA